MRNRTSLAGLYPVVSLTVAGSAAWAAARMVAGDR